MDKQISQRTLGMPCCHCMELLQEFAEKIKSLSTDVSYAHMRIDELEQKKKRHREGYPVDNYDDYTEEY